MSTKQFSKCSSQGCNQQQTSESKYCGTCRAHKEEAMNQINEYEQILADVYNLPDSDTKWILEKIVKELWGFS